MEALIRNVSLKPIFSYYGISTLFRLIYILMGNEQAKTTYSVAPAGDSSKAVTLYREGNMITADPTKDISQYVDKVTLDDSARHLLTPAEIRYFQSTKVDPSPGEKLAKDLGKEFEKTAIDTVTFVPRLVVTGAKDILKEGSSAASDVVKEVGSAAADVIGDVTTNVSASLLNNPAVIIGGLVTLLVLLRR